MLSPGFSRKFIAAPEQDPSSSRRDPSPFHSNPEFSTLSRFPVDIVLQASSGDQVRAHRILLSMASPVCARVCRSGRRRPAAPTDPLALDRVAPQRGPGGRRRSSGLAVCVSSSKRTRRCHSTAEVVETHTAGPLVGSRARRPSGARAAGTPGGIPPVPGSAHGVSRILPMCVPESKCSCACAA